MKKLLTSLLAGVIVLAFACPVFADATISGTYRIRGWYADNLLMQNDSDDTARYYDNRARIGLKAAPAENLEFNIRFDMNEGVLGENSTKPNLAVDQAYVQFAIPGTSWTARLGRQDVSWFNGVIARLDNRDRLWFAGKYGANTIGFATDKTTEAVRPADEDYDFYAAFLVSTAVPGWKLGVIAAPLLNSSVAAESTQNDSTILLLGVAGAGKVGPASLQFEAAYKGGTLKAQSYDEAAAAWSGVWTETDLAGMGFYANAGMPLGAASLNLELAYATGNDPDTADNEAYAFDRDSNFQNVILFNDTLTIAPVAGDSGFTNGMSVKVSAGFPVLAKGKVGLSACWATANEPSDDYGTEIDATFAYNLYDNLSFSLGAGFLMLGDYYGSDIDDIIAGVGKVEISF